MNHTTPTASLILVTGASGFLGGQLLVRLIVRDSRPIVCLVRADDVRHADRRGHIALRSALGRAPTRAESERVRWLPGDLERPRFGLSPVCWRELAAGVAEIFHCGASTRFDLPLAAARRVNVGGLGQVLALATEARANGRFRRLHHVSTAYVAGYARGTVAPDFLPDDRPESFHNTYERSKAEAERLLRTRSDLPLTVYRPSIIVGDARTGRTTSWNVVYYPMRLLADGRLPLAPRGTRSGLDCVPVDYVAEGILALAGRDDTAGRSFHLTAGTHALPIRDAVRFAEDGIERRTGLRPKRSPRLRARIERFGALAPYATVQAAFDDGETARLLAAAGLRLPSPAEFFPAIVDYAIAHDFGRSSRAEVLPRVAVGDASSLLSLPSA